MPPSSGKRAESAATDSAEGTKNSAAASTQSDIERGPVCAAAAAQRLPTTAALLHGAASGGPLAEPRLLVFACRWQDVIHVPVDQSGFGTRSVGRGNDQVGQCDECLVLVIVEQFRFPIARGNSSRSDLVSRCG